MSKMLHVRSFAAFAAAVVLMLGSARLASAADAKDKDAKGAKGTISGTVTGADGNPAKNVKVQLFASRPRGERATQAELENGEVFVAEPAPGDRPRGERPPGDRPGRGQRQQALKETTTNDKGEFTFADVAPGEYSVSAAEGNNVARGRTTVKAGETAKVTLALKAREPRGNRGNRGNNNQGGGDAPKAEGAK